MLLIVYVEGIQPVYLPTGAFIQLFIFTTSVVEI